MKNKILIIILPLLILNLFLVSAVSITSVSNFPVEVAPGEITDIKIEIKNTLEGDIHNLNVKLDLKDVPFAPYQSSSEKFQNELDEDDKESFRFKIMVLPSTSSGVYKIPMEISYEYESGNGTVSKTKTGTISIIVNAKPELKISLDDSVFLIKGKENTFSIKVINSGLADVKFVYITANNVAGIKFLTEREQYIGDIDSDDFDNVEYRTYIDDNVLDVITLPVIIKFKDAINKEFVENKELTIRTYSEKEAQRLGLIQKSNYVIYIIIISILILIYIIYRIRKRKKLKKSRD